MAKKRLLLTGAAGFIGSNFFKQVTSVPEIKKEYRFTVLDNLTYASTYETIRENIESDSEDEFIQADIRDLKALEGIFDSQKFSGLINFAAETHVDRSIASPDSFFSTNIMGTLNLLNLSLAAYRTHDDFRFLQVSTDEVYGSLSIDESAFTENSPLLPNSPYSSSKAGADLMCRSFYKTFGLPVCITRCSNNFGPFQYPEKLIPLMILRARDDLSLPIYGKGENIRDWIHVDDHSEGIWAVFNKGKAGEIYNLGGGHEISNLDLVKQILSIMKKPDSLISFVEDRPGHDFRYAIDYSKSEKKLQWKPRINFESGLEITVKWYLDNQKWLDQLGKVNA